MKKQDITYLLVKNLNNLILNNEFLFLLEKRLSVVKVIDGIDGPFKIFYITKDTITITINEEKQRLSITVLIFGRIFLRLIRIRNNKWKKK